MRKPYEIHDGLFIIGGGGLTGSGDCLIYVIRTTKGLVLIDAGLGEDIEQLIENIKVVGLDPNNLKALIITHCHIDHIGGVASLKKKYDLETYAHKYDVPAIEGEKLVMTGATMYGVDYEPIKIDHVLTAEKGEDILDFGDYQLVCIHTPGHTPGSICIYTDIKKTRVLFAQDVHGPLFDGFGSNVADFVESLNRLKKLGAQILCEGHFGIYQPAEEVEKYIQRYVRQYSRRE
ncbi:MAG: MBL fold metallo-hydrolase [Candidatus Helarchaeota archaeon]|nr:MBL fold metallo-hydrolase [Candidatus Helarchaeota archaeon]